MTEKKSLTERFWEKVEKTDSCWIWTGRVNSKKSPYGRMSGEQGQTIAAHRFSYELMNGPIPEGLVIDHLCRNTLCVNHAHLEAVTDKENILRGIGTGAKNAKKEFCNNGHPLSGDNLRLGFNGKNPRRYCKQCNREDVKAGYWRRVRKEQA